MAPKRNAEASDRSSSLTPAALHVLLALADGDKHGWAILKEVALSTDDRIINVLYYLGGEGRAGLTPGKSRVRTRLNIGR